MKKSKLKYLVLCLLLCVLIFGYIAPSNRIMARAASTETEQETFVSKPLMTTVYTLDDSSGNGNDTYIANKNKKNYPNGFLTSPYANISIDALTQTGVVESAGTKNLIPAYGVKTGTQASDTGAFFEIALKFNTTSKSELGINKWQINNDSAEYVNKIRVGVIKSGALVVQKSYDGEAWEFYNPVTNGISTNFHTTDFINEYNKPTTDKVSIYQNSGDDLNKGVFLKVLLAYEISFEYKWTEKEGTWYTLGIGKKTVTKSKWIYKNILEETMFFIANSASDITFTNASTENQETDDSMSELIAHAGTIKTNHQSLSGFRLNKENKYLKVWYLKNITNYNLTDWIEAEDGKFFTGTGKYTFKVQAPTGDIRYYDIYINNRDVNGAVVQYFGQNGLITSDSVRVFSTTDEVPVYVAGRTNFRLNAVDNWSIPCIGIITNLTTGKEIFVNSTCDDETVTGIFNRNQTGGAIADAGEYVANFYSNPDYFGEMSGDAYHFTFKFNVINADEVPGSMINQELLYNLTDISEFNSLYYGVSVLTQSAGNLIYAFPSYSAAYGFAYSCELAKVEVDGNNYFYDNNIYSSQFDVLTAVDINSHNLVEKRYFDLNDANSYTTYAGIVDDVTSLNLQQNVIVFDSDYTQSSMKVGEALLNSRVYRYLNADGTISEGRTDVKFVQIANFESNTIKAKNETTGIEYNLLYNVSVEQQMQGFGAATGRYKICETTVDTSAEPVEYYAVYIAPNDNATMLNVGRFYNNVFTETTITQAQNSQSQLANGFVLKSAVNTFDAYGIVKICKNGAVPTIYALKEIENLFFDEEGEYEITVVDRVGNSYKYFYTILTACKSYDVSFETTDETVVNQTVFYGQTILLPVPSRSDDTMKFMGWKFNETLITNGQFTLTQNADCQLSEVWHYKQVELSLYDGVLTDTIICQVEDLKLLSFPAKDGFTFYGWHYLQPGGLAKFYYGQITSVPNVAAMRLDAVWTKNGIPTLPTDDNQCAITFVNGQNVSTIYADYGDIITLPNATENGMIFFGWQYSQTPTTGIIYDKNDQFVVPENDCAVLTALWLTDADSIPQGGGPTIMGTTGTTNSSLGNLLGSLFTSEIASDVTATLLMIILLIVLIYWLLGNRKLFANNASKMTLFDTKIVKKQSKMNAFIEEKTAVLLATTQATKTIVSNAQKSTTKSIISTTQTTVETVKIKAKSAGQAEQLVDYYTPQKFKAERKPFFRAGFYVRTIVPIICCFLIVALVGILIGQELPVGVFAKQEITTDTAATSLDYTPATTDGLDPKLQIALPDGETFGEYINTVVNTSGVSDSGVMSDGQANEEFDELNLTDEEAFLYSLILIDYLSFGYDVFPSVAVRPDGEKIFNLLYVNYEDIFEDENGELIIGCGIVPILNQPVITDQDIEEGVFIEMPAGDDGETIKYIVAFSETYGDCHYVAFDKYVTYGVGDSGVYYSSKENMVANYNAELGRLYNYDLGRIVFDPAIGESFNLGAISLNTLTDYELVQQSMQSYIAQQNANGLAVDTVNVTYISMEAYNAWLLSGQDETFLGFSTEEIQLFESGLAETEFYYVTADGQLHAADFPPPTPEAPTFMERFMLFATAITVLAIGIVLSVTINVLTCGTAIVATQILNGAFMGAGMALLFDAIAGKGINDVNWVKVGVAAVTGALCAIPGVGWVGAAFIGGTSSAVSTAIDGGSLSDCFKAFVIGVATAVIIHGATKLLGKVASGIADKLGKCFVAGTAILVLENGVQVVKNIEDIMVGDLVASYNEQIGIIEYKPVTQTFKNIHSEIIKIKTKNGVISSSISHPYYTNRGIIEAQNLRAGDVLQTTNGQQVVVKNVKHEQLKQSQVLYNFEVQDNHNYFVAENNTTNSKQFVLVHNFCNKNNLSPFQKYKIGMKKAGITQNTKSFKINDRIRIPDQWDDMARLIGEVKNVKSQAFTCQLRDYLQYADDFGYNFNLYTRETTKFTKPLAELIKTGKINWIPWR